LEEDGIEMNKIIQSYGFTPEEFRKLRYNSPLQSVKDCSKALDYYLRMVERSFESNWSFNNFYDGLSDIFTKRKNPKLTRRKDRGIWVYKLKEEISNEELG